MNITNGAAVSAADRWAVVGNTASAINFGATGGGTLSVKMLQAAGVASRRRQDQYHGLEADIDVVFNSAHPANAGVATANGGNITVQVWT